MYIYICIYIYIFDITWRHWPAPCHRLLLQNTLSPPQRGGEGKDAVQLEEKTVGKMLVSLNKALLKPYFWGGYVRGVGWLAIMASLVYFLAEKNATKLDTLLRKTEKTCWKPHTQNDWKRKRKATKRKGPPLRFGCRIPSPKRPTWHLMAVISIYVYNTPPKKLTCPLKNSGWKMILFTFWNSPFSGEFFVSFCGAVFFLAILIGLEPELGSFIHSHPLFFFGYILFGDVNLFRVFSEWVLAEWSYLSYLLASLPSKISMESRRRSR